MLFYGLCPTLTPSSTGKEGPLSQLIGWNAVKEVAGLICGTISPCFHQTSIKTIRGERMQSQDFRQPQYEAAITVSERGSDGSRHAVPRMQLAWDFAVLDDLFISEAIGSPHQFSQGERNCVDKKSCVTEPVFALFLTFTP